MLSLTFITIKFQRLDGIMIGPARSRVHSAVRHSVAFRHTPVPGAVLHAQRIAECMRSINWPLGHAHGDGVGLLGPLPSLSAL